MTYLSDAEKAKQLRIDLKQAFPNVKFWVTSKHSIRVSWVDGPTDEDVKTIAYRYRDVSYCEASGEILSGGNTFVFTDRRYSQEALRAGIDAVKGKNYVKWEDIDFGAIVIELASDGRAYDIKYDPTHTTFSTGFRESLASDIYAAIKDVDFRDLAVRAEAQDAPAAVGIVNDSETTVALNNEKNGVEVKFAQKPATEVIAALKVNGFRWSNKQGLWYAKQAEETINFARSLMPVAVTGADEALDVAVEDDDLFNLDEILEYRQLISQQQQPEIIEPIAEAVTPTLVAEELTACQVAAKLLGQAFPDEVFRVTRLAPGRDVEQTVINWEGGSLIGDVKHALWGYENADKYPKLWLRRRSTSNYHDLDQTGAPDLNTLLW